MFSLTRRRYAFLASRVRVSRFQRRPLGQSAAPTAPIVVAASDASRSSTAPARSGVAAAVSPPVSDRTAPPAAALSPGAGQEAVDWFSEKVSPDVVAKTSSPFPADQAAAAASAFVASQWPLLQPLVDLVQRTRAVSAHGAVAGYFQIDPTSDELCHALNSAKHQQRVRAHPFTGRYVMHLLRGLSAADAGAVWLDDKSAAAVLSAAATFAPSAITSVAACGSAMRRVLLRADTMPLYMVALTAQSLAPTRQSNVDQQPPEVLAVRDRLIKCALRRGLESRDIAALSVVCSAVDKIYGFAPEGGDAPDVADFVQHVLEVVHARVEDGTFAPGDEQRSSAATFTRSFDAPLSVLATLARRRPAHSDTVAALALLGGTRAASRLLGYQVGQWGEACARVTAAARSSETLAIVIECLTNVLDGAQGPAFRAALPAHSACMAVSPLARCVALLQSHLHASDFRDESPLNPGRSLFVDPVAVSDLTLRMAELCDFTVELALTVMETRTGDRGRIRAQELGLLLGAIDALGLHGTVGAVELAMWGVRLVEELTDAALGEAVSGAPPGLVAAGANRLFEEPSLVVLGAAARLMRHVVATLAASQIGSQPLAALWLRLVSTAHTCETALRTAVTYVTGDTAVGGRGAVDAALTELEGINAALVPAAVVIFGDAAVAGMPPLTLAPTEVAAMRWVFTGVRGSTCDHNQLRAILQYLHASTPTEQADAGSQLRRLLSRDCTALQGRSPEVQLAARGFAVQRLLQHSSGDDFEVKRLVSDCAGTILRRRMRYGCDGYVLTPTELAVLRASMRCLQRSPDDCAFLQRAAAALAQDVDAYTSSGRGAVALVGVWAAAAAIGALAAAVDDAATPASCGTAAAVRPLLRQVERFLLPQEVHVGLRTAAAAVATAARLEGYHTPDSSLVTAADGASCSDDNDVAWDAMDAEDTEAAATCDGTDEEEVFLHAAALREQALEAAANPELREGPPRWVGIAERTSAHRPSVAAHFAILAHSLKPQCALGPHLSPFGDDAGSAGDGFAAGAKASARTPLPPSPTAAVLAAWLAGTALSGPAAATAADAPAADAALPCDPVVGNAVTFAVRILAPALRAAFHDGARAESRAGVEMYWFACRQLFQVMAACPPALTREAAHWIHQPRLRLDIVGAEDGTILRLHGGGHVPATPLLSLAAASALPAMPGDVAASLLTATHGGNGGLASGAVVAARALSRGCNSESSPPHHPSAETWLQRCEWARYPVPSGSGWATVDATGTVGVSVVRPDASAADALGELQGVALQLALNGDTGFAPSLSLRECTRMLGAFAPNRSRSTSGTDNTEAMAGPIAASRYARVGASVLRWLQAHRSLRGGNLSAPVAAANDWVALGEAIAAFLRVPSPADMVVPAPALASAAATHQVCFAGGGVAVIMDTAVASTAAALAAPMSLMWAEAATAAAVAGHTTDALALLVVAHELSTRLSTSAPAAAPGSHAGTSADGAAIRALRHLMAAAAGNLDGQLTAASPPLPMALVVAALAACDQQAGDAAARLVPSLAQVLLQPVSPAAGRAPQAAPRLRNAYATADGPSLVALAEAALRHLHRGDGVEGPRLNVAAAACDALVEQGTLASCDFAAVAALCGVLGPLAPHAALGAAESATNFRDWVGSFRSVLARAAVRMAHSHEACTTPHLLAFTTAAAAWGVLPPALALAARDRLRVALTALAPGSSPASNAASAARDSRNAAVVARACGALAPFRVPPASTVKLALSSKPPEPEPLSTRPHILEELLKPAARAAMRFSAYDAETDWGGSGAAPEATAGPTVVDGPLMWAVLASELRAASTVAGLKAHLWAAAAGPDAQASRWSPPLADAVLSAWVGDR